MSRGAIDIKNLNNRLKRLENKVSKNLPEWLDEQQQKDFISEKAQAIENYLKCKPDEQDKALDEIYKINRKHRFEDNAALPAHLKHYLD